MRVRPLEPADAAAAFAIRTAGWRQAYAGLVPDAYLADLDEPGRRRVWEERTRARRPGEHAVAAVLDGPEGERLTGFAVGGPDRDRSRTSAELYLIYVHPDRWGTGAAQALLDAVTGALVRDGHDELGLWVLAGNARARRCYERFGLVATGEVKVVDLAGPVEQVRHAGPLPPAGRAGDGS